MLSLPPTFALQFLSTPSARRATVGVYYYTYATSISIHALREEGDSIKLARPNQETDFYPRPPRGGRPAAAACFSATCFISIHALREEGD